MYDTYRYVLDMSGMPSPGHIYIYLLYVYIYICIYIERERHIEREREIDKTSSYISYHTMVPPIRQKALASDSW